MSSEHNFIISTLTSENMVISSNISYQIITFVDICSTQREQTKLSGIMKSQDSLLDPT